MSEAETVYSFDTGYQSYEIGERDEITVVDCPKDIGDRLLQASFHRESPNVYVKKQESEESDQDFTVVKATYLRSQDELRIEARDIVGVLSLTPTKSLQINPKIEWEHIFDMVLAIQDQKRSLEFHGVPIQDFTSGDIDLSDIFLIFAINYLQGLQKIHKKGFIRDLVTRREDRDDIKGRIDFSRTLLNKAEGRSQIHCQIKEVEHDNTANSLLHFAGMRLIRMFQQHAEDYDHPAYDRLFSKVHREVENLESLGVTSDVTRTPKYRAFDIHDLPRQRDYYKQAVDISKSIVSSSLGKQMESGQERLVIDYVLNMENLFEQYSTVVLKNQLDRIKSYDHPGLLDTVTVEDSSKKKPFREHGGIYHQPDHVIEDTGEALAIADSKYYGEDHDPITDRDARSQIFSYSYLYDCNKLAYLCPLQKSKRWTVEQTDAELQVVSPEEFTLEAYDEVLYEYLYGVLRERYPLLEVLRAVYENELCLDQASERDLAGLGELGSSTGFSFTDAEQFSLRAVKYAANDLSFDVRNMQELEQDGEWTRERLEDMFSRYNSSTTRCVPVFVDEGRQEKLRPYFIRYTGDDVVVEEGRELKLL